MAEVSIIVTAYNIERYIEQCLESVAAQTLSDIEVLVVDDGSSDATPQKIAEFCDGDPRFVPVLLRAQQSRRRGDRCQRGSRPCDGAVGRVRRRRRLRRADACSSGWSMPPPPATRIWRCASTRRSSTAPGSAATRPMRTGGPS